MKFYLFLILILSGCSFKEGLKDGLQKEASVEKAALTMAKENRELRARAIQLETELKKFQKEPIGVKRSMASYNLQRLQSLEDNWKPDEMQFVAEIEYEREDFEKAAYFYNGILKKFPEFEMIDDQLLFKAARANYESGKNYKRALEIFEKIVKEYPKSQFFLQSKLWIGLIQFKIGEKKNAKEKIIEFQEKYQNSPEWKILEKNYEKIIKI
jgi:outer membrane protein assembly factor BamD (BamD/ComL family)